MTDGIRTNQSRVSNFQQNPAENEPNPGLGLKKSAGVGQCNTTDQRYKTMILNKVANFQPKYLVYVTHRFDLKKFLS